MQGKVVIIEGEQGLSEAIEYNLTVVGFGVTFSRDGEEGVELVKRESPNIVLLDLVLPGLDGIEICRRLKSDAETSAIPVILVTAKGKEDSIAVGLGVGADDYIIKPFSPKELVACVKNVLRRVALRDEIANAESIIRKGLVLNLRRREVIVDKKPVSFTGSEFRLLQTLATYPGRVFTRDMLVSRIAKHDEFIIERNIDVHIRSVRKKLGPYRSLIETVRRIGYRFSDKVEWEIPGR